MRKKLFSTNLPVRTVYPEHALLSNCLILPLCLLSHLREFSFSESWITDYKSRNHLSHRCLLTF